MTKNNLFNQIKNSEQIIREKAIIEIIFQKLEATGQLEEFNKMLDDNWKEHEKERKTISKKLEETE
jgi:cupin superfamily acireductone dioxygenase involved in methionine salvage